MPETKIWVSKPASGGSEIKKKNLKALCEAIGMSYNTAKKRRVALRDEKKDDEVFSWFDGKEVHNIWRETI